MTYNLFPIDGGYIKCKKQKQCYSGLKEQHLQLLYRDAKLNLNGSVGLVTSVQLKVGHSDT